jgi:hypothetical protein
MCGFSMVEILFFRITKSNQIYQVGFKDRNKLIRFLFPEFGFNQKNQVYLKSQQLRENSFFP